MPVTLKDVANRTGLSLVTVSHVLGSRPGKYPPETQERVRNAAQELGYRANASARAIRSGRFNCVALALSRTDAIRSLTPAGLLGGIHDALTEREQRLLVTGFSDEELTDPAFVPQILRESAADGLLINYNALIPPLLFDLVTENRLPAVWINSQQAADCVYPDDRAGVAEAVRQLYALGHRRIAYADFVCTTHYSGPDRRAGYEDAAHDLHLTPIVFQPRSTPRQEDWLALADAALADPERPTAIVAYIHQVAESFLLAAARRGLRVPEDLSLIAVTEHPTRHFGAAFGSLLLPEREMGRASVEMLLTKIAEPSRPLPPLALPLSWEPGGTVAATPPSS